VSIHYNIDRSLEGNFYQRQALLLFTPTSAILWHTCQYIVYNLMINKTRSWLSEKQLISLRVVCAIPHSLGCPQCLMERIIFQTRNTSIEKCTSIFLGYVNLNTKIILVSCNWLLFIDKMKMCQIYHCESMLLFDKIMAIASLHRC
jgi:hypothetical protein